jgi:hypothetical protein
MFRLHASIKRMQLLTRVGRAAAQYIGFSIPVATSVVRSCDGL